MIPHTTAARRQTPPRPPTMPPISARLTPSSSFLGGEAGSGAAGGDGGGGEGGGETRTSFVGATIASTVTGLAVVLRKAPAVVVSASLAVTLVSARSAAASLCMFTVKSILTLAAVGLASTASRGTAASSATFWRMGVSTAGVKSATAPAMVTAILMANDAGGGAYGGDGGGGDGDGGDGDAEGGGDGDAESGGGDDATVAGEGDGDAEEGVEGEHETPGWGWG